MCLEISRTKGQRLCLHSRLIRLDSAFKEGSRVLHATTGKCPCSHTAWGEGAWGPWGLYRTESIRWMALQRQGSTCALATVMGFPRCLPNRAVTYVRWMPPAKGQSSPKEEKHLLTLCRLRIFAISGFQVMSPFMNWQSFVPIPFIAVFRPGLSYSREVTEISNLSLSVARQHILPRALVALHGPSHSSCLPGPINFSIYILASDTLWDRNFKAFLEKKLPSFESTSVEAPDWSLTWTCS